MEFVKSTYRARWLGVILEKQKRNKLEDLVTVLIVRDQHGNLPKKRILHTLSIKWTIPSKPVDISMINKDWFNSYEFHIKRKTY